MKITSVVDRFPIRFDWAGRAGASGGTEATEVLRFVNPREEGVSREMAKKGDVWKQLIV